MSRLMSLQHELHSEYHSDGQLRDHLLNAVDISAIKDSIKDRTPRTAHQLNNRVSNRLSTGKTTAGSISALRAAPTYDPGDEDAENEVQYTLCQNYAGDARRTLRPYGPRRGSTGGR